MLFQLLSLLFSAVLGLRLLFPPVDADIYGLAVWIQSLFTVFLIVYVLFTALGLGRRFLNWLPGLARLEQYLVAMVLGLAVLSNGILVLGLVGLLNLWVIYGWLMLCGLAASYQWREILDELQNKLRSLRRIKPNELSVFEYIFFAVLACFLILLPIVSLAPVRDYDALMYHLPIPLLFLEHGRIYFDPAVWRSAQPMMTEMLFLIGIIFHADSFSQLVSLAFCAIFFLSVFSFGRRFFNSTIALLSVGILLGSPGFPLYATSPSVEFSWASYEMWSIYAFSIWLISNKDEKRHRWLVFAGLMSGLAATTKYLSFPILGIMGLIVFWKSIQQENWDIKILTGNILMFGVPALLVLSPWYLKNWIWTGNPFYPLVFGGPGWTDLRRELVFNYYMGSFGTGTSWQDYVLIPINMYLFQPNFSLFRMEIFHPILWLGFAFVFLIAWRKYDYLIVYVALYFLLWAVSLREIRFLFPMSGILALLSAKVISQFPSALRKGVSLIFVGGFMILTLLNHFYIDFKPYVSNYFVGRISKSQVIEEGDSDYKTVQFIMKNLNETARVLFLWSGRGYYCDTRCLPDDTQSYAIQLSMDSPDPESLASQLRADGITHIYLNSRDFDWFVIYHDPKGLHQAAFDYFEKEFFPVCGDLIFRDNRLKLYSITCH